jgi:hypothetical protein
MGAKAATAAEMGAGVDVSVTRSSTGRIRDTRDNARLWAELRGQGARQRAQRDGGLQFPLTGRISASAGLSRRWMAPPSFFAAGLAVSGDHRIGTEFGIGQRVFDGLALGVSVRRQDAGLVASIKARLRFAW